MRNWATALKLAFVLVLVEGALRKWILPGAADLIYFAKDVVLVGVYLGFFLHGPGAKQGKSTPPSWIPMNLIKACLVTIAVLSLNPNVGSPVAILLGARGYLFYLPIILVVPYIFDNKEQMLRGLAGYMLIAIPICILGVVQFRSDSFSVINTYASGTSQWGASTFGGAEGQVRVTGTFSYLSGHVVFSATFFAMGLAVVSNPALPFRRVLLYVALPLIAGNVFMSGSRAAFLAAAVSIIGFTANGMGAITQSGKWRAVKSSVAIAVALGVIGLFMFSEAVDALYTRSTSVSDSLLVRIVESPIEHIALGWENGGFFGCGPGTTSSAVYALRAKLNLPEPEHHPGYYDLELGQIFAEVGATGFCAWYLFRVTIVVCLWRAYQRCRDEQLRTFILVTFLISLPFFLISLVLNHVACVLIWGMVGVSLASVRFSQESHHRRSCSVSQSKKRLPQTRRVPIAA